MEIKGKIEFNINDDTGIVSIDAEFIDYDKKGYGDFRIKCGENSWGYSFHNIEEGGIVSHFLGMNEDTLVDGFEQASIKRWDGLRSHISNVIQIVKAALMNMGKSTTIKLSRKESGNQ